MIYSLSGKLIVKEPSLAVIECAGVGYKCTISYNTLRALPELDENVRIFTYMNVREDSVDLFGFATKEELDSYKLLITVNGVGPKAGIAILSELSPDALALAISSGDIASIKAAQGIGPKTAQRIVLELKDKVGSVASVAQVSSGAVSLSGGDNKKEAVSALVTLGYSQAQASAAVSDVNASMPVEDIIKLALSRLF